MDSGFSDTEYMTGNAFDYRRHLWLPVTFAEAALILNDIVVYSNAAVLESIQSSLGRTADHCLPPD